MDSITKNIGEPFKSIFARKISNIFLGAYKKIVAPEIRNKLKHLLSTWDTVFGAELTKAIKEEVSKLDNPAINQYGIPSYIPNSTPIVLFSFYSIIFSLY